MKHIWERIVNWLKTSRRTKRITLAATLISILTYAILQKLKNHTAGIQKQNLPSTSEQSLNDHMPVDLEHCYDGDTCTFRLKKGNIKLRVRLVGMDSPELPRKSRKGQPNAEQSRDEIRRLLGLGTITIKSHGLDPYNRILGEVLVSDTKTREPFNANLQMIRTGLAWYYSKSPATIDKTQYQMAEDYARQERKGIWSGSEKQVTAEQFRRISRKKNSSH